MPRNRPSTRDRSPKGPRAPRDPALIHRTEDVCRLTGLSRFTVLRYQKLGVVPKGAGNGPARRYGDDHVLAIRTAHELARRLRSLARVKAALPAAIEDAKKRAREEAVRAAEAAKTAKAAEHPHRDEADAKALEAARWTLDSVTEAWSLVQIAPGLVLWVEKSAPAETRELAAKLLATGRRDASAGAVEDGASLSRRHRS